MTKLARQIVTIIVDEYGQDEFLRRVSDSFWFQALGCILGYDWHSSGVTTVLTGVLKKAIDPTGLGIGVCGGKGRFSLKAPAEITRVCEEFGLSTNRTNDLRYMSRMSAKIDNTAIQAGYPLYHHAFFITEEGKWAVVQQGMNIKDRTARRYHWLSENVKEFAVEPHKAIVGDTRRKMVLDMTSRASIDCQTTSTDIAKGEPKKIMNMLKSIRPAYQRSLKEWIPEARWKEYVVDVLSLPRSLNWKAVKRAYESQPEDYEELLAIRGIGPATVRGIALISELIYGDAPCWKDPVKYSFAYGGKDGVPYPVDRKAMDESIEVLENAIKSARIGDKEMSRSLRRLRQCVLGDKCA